MITNQNSFLSSFTYFLADEEGIEGKFLSLPPVHILSSSLSTPANKVFSSSVYNFVSTFPFTLMFAVVLPNVPATWIGSDKANPILSTAFGVARRLSGEIITVSAMVSLLLELASQASLV